MLAATPVFMGTEIGKLRDLLYESYRELEKCKEELVILDRERTQLLGILGEGRIEAYGLRTSRKYLYK